MSETTKREHKGQNRPVINWLTRVDAGRPFLFDAGRVWTYGEAAEAVASGQSHRVFDLIRRIDTEAGVTVATSGTTGAPKRITLTLGNIEAAAVASEEHLGHDSSDNWLLAMPLTHVGGMSIVARQLFTGGSITAFDSFEAGEIAEALKSAVTMVSVVPTMLRRLIPHGPFGGLRAVLVGGGPIPRGLLEEAHDVGLPVLPTYGMTETFGQVATLRPNAQLAYHVHPLPGVDIEIRQGRIALRSDQVSAQVVGPDGWFVTSDLGALTDGALEVLGRADNMIISGGVNVDPGRIEAALAPHADDVAVLGLPDDEWGEIVTCVYVGQTDLERIADELLDGPQRPRRFVRVDRIPRTAIGKYDRSAIEELL